MSQISTVLKQKKDIDKKRFLEKKEQLETMREESIYKAKLLDEMRILSILFDNDPSLESVIIEIPENNLTMFTRFMYTELEEYKISQIKGKANMFKVERRVIQY